MLRNVLTHNRVATGYGQPPNTYYDWTLGPVGQKEMHYALPAEMEARLRIEMFSNDVTKSLYRNDADPEGLAPDAGKSILTNFLVKQFHELEDALKPDLSRMSDFDFSPFPHCLDDFSCFTAKTIKARGPMTFLVKSSSPS